MRDILNKWFGPSDKGSAIKDDFFNDASEGFAMFPTAGSKLGILGLKFKLILLKKTWIMLTLPSKLMIGGAIVSITSIVYLTATLTPEQIPAQQQISPISQFSDLDSNQITIKNTDTLYNIIAVNENRRSSTELANIYESDDEIDKVMSSPEMIELIGNSPLCNSSIPTITVNPTPLYWIGEYRIIDYSKIRDEESPMISMTFSGLNAKYENQTQVAGDEELLQRDTIPYTTYASMALGFLKSGHYNESIKKWGLVLSQYPDDENALFYIGYSNFRLKNYQKSLAYLQKAEAGYFQVFDEESLWFIAQSLIELRHFDESKKILTVIIESNSHYAPQARTIYEKLP